MFILAISRRIPRVVLVVVEIRLLRRRPGGSVRVWLGLLLLLLLLLLLRRRLLLLLLLLLLIVLIVLRPVVWRVAERGRLLLLLLWLLFLERHHGNARGSLDPVGSLHCHYPRLIHVAVLLRLFPAQRRQSHH